MADATVSGKEPRCVRITHELCEVDLALKLELLSWQGEGAAIDENGEPTDEWAYDLGDLSVSVWRLSAGGYQAYALLLLDESGRRVGAPGAGCSVGHAA
jgi:hypothetical protein